MKCLGVHYWGGVALRLYFFFENKTELFINGFYFIYSCKTVLSSALHPAACIASNKLLSSFNALREDQKS